MVDQAETTMRVSTTAQPSSSGPTSVSLSPKAECDASGGGSVSPGRILHVVESFGSGVKNSVLSYVANTPEFEHHLLWSTHADTTVDEVDLRHFSSHERLPSGHVDRLKAVRAAVTQVVPNIVHAHSSWAGLYVRLALRPSQRLSILYTPHGYSFQRQDLPAPARMLFRLVEWSLSFNTTMVVACGQHEARLSAWPFRHPPIGVVPNVAHTFDTEDELDHASHGTSSSAAEPASGPPVIVGAGRLCNAKDPAFFAATIRELRAAGIQVRAVWIGDGEEHFARDLTDANVEITGWLSRDDAGKVLREASVYLHTARWEGFPLSVLEAASLGVPMIGRDIGALRDEGLPLLFRQPADIVGLWRRLEDDDERQATMAFVRRLADSHSDSRQANTLRVIYGDLSGPELTTSSATSREAAR
ncbi:glycosyltransferase [Planctomonas sp. JC2975]|nr:glycosyltransferase [Planctomonas sp. JC2975]